MGRRGSEPQNFWSAETGAEDEPAVAAIDNEQGLTEQLVAQAREKGIELVARTGC
jgi:hypothetical protein